MKLPWLSAPEEYCPEYYDCVAQLADTGAERFIIANLQGKVLDVGCGLGRFPSDAGLDRSRYAVAHNKRGNAVLGDGDVLPFRDNSFDTVLCNHAIEHMDDADKAMQEFARVGSRLVLAYPSKDYLPFRLRLWRQTRLHKHELGRDFIRPPWKLVKQRVFRFGYNVVSVFAK